MIVCVSCSVMSDSLCHPMDCSPPGFSVYRILQAIKLEWVTIPFFFRGSSWPRDQIQVSCIAGRFLTVWAPGKPFRYGSVQFSRSAVSNSLWTHESQHTRPPCPSPTPEVHSDSRPSSQWCHPAISSSVVPFSSCPQSLPASGFFPMSQLFTWGGQSTGVSALASFLPKKSQISFRMDWLDLLAVQGTLKSLLQHHSSKASILYG